MSMVEVRHGAGTITCVIGEIHLVTDVEEVLLTPGDTVVIRAPTTAGRTVPASRASSWA
jgi:uncharacterized cupin superfamily protein